MSDRPVRVLVVDDDEDDYVLARELLQEIESGPGFETEWVARYQPALGLIARDEHDVYLVDYHLGGADGLELIRQARRGGCLAPMIVLTGLGDREVDLRAMEAGATDYLVKGRIDAPLLERSIRYAIERSRSERLRASFVTLASQELRAPVLALRNQAISLLLDDPGTLGDHVVEVVGRLIQTADHCARLIDGFLDLVRVESRRAVAAETGRFDVRGLVEEAVEITVLGGATCTFAVDIEPQVGHGRGDRYEVLLVMLNLLANAAAYSEPGGAVSISVRATEGVLRFAVTDRGPGIPPHVLPDLFTPFYLIRDAGRRKARGTGLGLCSAKHLVEASEGRIWVESELGKGTTVLFEIPAAQ